MSYIKKVIEEVCTLYHDGLTFTEIVNKCNLNPDDVRYILDNFYDIYYK